MFTSNSGDRHHTLLLFAEWHDGPAGPALSHGRSADLNFTEGRFFYSQRDTFAFYFQVKQTPPSKTPLLLDGWSLPCSRILLSLFNY